MLQKTVEKYPESADAHSLYAQVCVTQGSILSRKGRLLVYYCSSADNRGWECNRVDKKHAMREQKNLDDSLENSRGFKFGESKG